MYFDDEMTKEDITDQLIREEMHKTKEKVVERLFSHKMHVLYCEEIALMIANGFFESYAPALKLAEELNFSKLDLLAVLEYFEEFREEFLENMEEQLDFEDL